MMFVISRIEQYKFSSCAAVFAESERSLARYDNPDYCPEKSADNVYLYSPVNKHFGLSIVQYILKRKKDLKCRMSIDPNLPLEKQTNVMCQAFFGASPEFFEGMSRDDIVLYFQHCLDFFQEEFPSVELVSAVIHFDEVTPHLHINFLPLVSKVNSKGKEKIVFSTSELFKGKHFFGAYQDSFWLRMSNLYPEKNLERKGDTKQDHLTVKEYKERQREIDRLEDTLEEMRSELSEISDYIEDAKSVPALAIRIENAELRRELSYYRKLAEYLLKKFPSLQPVFDFFRGSRATDRDR